MEEEVLGVLLKKKKKIWEWKSSKLKILHSGLLQPPCNYKKGKESQQDHRAIELTLKMTTPDVLLFKKIYSLLKSQ